MTETQEQLIQSIEQQLENLMTLDDDLYYEYEYNLYHFDKHHGPIAPIVELFTPELLKELEHLVYELDND